MKSQDVSVGVGESYLKALELVPSLAVRVRAGRREERGRRYGPDRGFLPSRRDFPNSLLRILAQRLIRRERFADGFEDLLVLGEAEPIFLGDNAVANPDRELAAVPFDELRADFQLTFEQVRHTGGARSVVSNDAVAYGNRLHCGNLLLPPDYSESAAKMVRYSRSVFAAGRRERRRRMVNDCGAVARRPHVRG